MGGLDQTSKLEAARAYEARVGSCIGGEGRPAYHLSPYVGWMNDPNGFSCYKGQYHLFYQYHPYSTVWGPMHWGHAVSEDLLHWAFLPCALAPDASFDEAGCFSGSAIELDDGRQLLLYTGVRHEGVTQEGLPVSRQAQCVAIGDGVDYEKAAGNPLIHDSVLPAGWMRQNFRDPKIWREEDGSYRCVVGAAAEDGDGCVLLFSSEDALSWKYVGEVARNGHRFGMMWECPDLFELDGKEVLLVSPLKMLTAEYERLGGCALYCIGTLGEDGHTFVEETLHAIDYGIDFYAPQTTLTPDGRRVMIAWMQNWDTTRLLLPDRRWFGQMTVPRELRVRDGRLFQWPVREIEDLRGTQVAYQDVTVDDRTELEGIEGRCADIVVRVRPATEASLGSFTVNVAEGQDCRTTLTLDLETGRLCLDRRYSGARRMVVHTCACDVTPTEGYFDLRILLDRFSIEVFAGGGEQAMSMVIPTELAATGISFDAKGKVVMDIEKYALDTDR